MTSTPDLIAAAQHGDQHALADLYRAHQSTVHRYIARRVSSADLADDLTQETFVRMLRGISTYQWTGRPIDAWLYTIARNLIADHHKRAAHRPETLVADPSALPHPTAVAAEQQAVAALDAAPIRAALGTLHPSYRQALVLQHWAGMTDRQIAAHTGRTVGGVKSAKHRAAVALRAALAA